MIINWNELNDWSRNMGKEVNNFILIDKFWKFIISVEFVFV